MRWCKSKWFDPYGLYIMYRCWTQKLILTCRYIPSAFTLYSLRCCWFGHHGDHMCNWTNDCLSVQNKSQEIKCVNIYILHAKKRFILDKFVAYFSLKKSVFFTLFQDALLQDLFTIPITARRWEERRNLMISSKLTQSHTFVLITHFNSSRIMLSVFNLG